MTNSADADQLSSSEANRSGSTLFAKVRQIPGSAELALKVFRIIIFRAKQPEQIVKIKIKCRDYFWSEV